MNSYKVENIAAVISYIEAHLNEKLDLDTVANAVCYSKYHLHRIDVYKRQGLEGHRNEYAKALHQ